MEQHEQDSFEVEDGEPVLEEVVEGVVVVAAGAPPRAAA